jgi:anti-anti-sigma factor
MEWYTISSDKADGFSGKRAMGFKTKVRKVKGVPVLEIRGDFAGENAAQAALLLEKMRASTNASIAVDLNRTTFIDSVGLGVFVYCWRLLENDNRKMLFIKPQGFVLKMLESTSLDRVFKVVDELD